MESGSAGSLTSWLSGELGPYFLMGTPVPALPLEPTGCSRGCQLQVPGTGRALPGSWSQGALAVCPGQVPRPAGRAQASMARQTAPFLAAGGSLLSVGRPPGCCSRMGQAEQMLQSALRVGFWQEQPSRCSRVQEEVRADAVLSSSRCGLYLAPSAPLYCSCMPSLALVMPPLRKRGCGLQEKLTPGPGGL